MNEIKKLNTNAFFDSISQVGQNCGDCKFFNSDKKLGLCCNSKLCNPVSTNEQNFNLSNLGIKNKMKNSELLWTKATQLIPGGTQTLGKSPIGFIDGVAPKFISHGKGSRTWDVDGNEFIDCWLAALPITFGHRNKNIDDAIRGQLEKGISFSLMTELESQVASLIKEDVPIAEQIRFAKNGSDVCEAAVRLSRYITGKNYVITFGYHGFHDWYIGSTDRSFGVPEVVSKLTMRTKYNDMEHLKNLFKLVKGDVACVIMEPTIFEHPSNGYLQEVKEFVHKNGALLIFDEMLTGYRFDVGGAMSFFGVYPDLATFGKGIANGMPIAMLVGPEKHMRHFDKVFLSSTYGGETLSLAAALAGLMLHKEHDVIGHLWSIGYTVMSGCKKLIETYNLQGRVNLIGYPVRQTFTFNDSDGYPDLKLAGLFQQEMLKNGVLCNAGLGFSLAHSTVEAEFIVNSFKKACEKIKSAIDNNNVDQMLEGVPAQPVFKSLRDQRVTSN